MAGAGDRVAVRDFMRRACALGVAVLLPFVALAWLAVTPRAAPDGARGYTHMIAALDAQQTYAREQSVIDTNSAGMTFAIALRGKTLDVEFPFPGPAARHRYRFAVDRRTTRAWAERIDAGGRIVAGPIRGHASILFPLTAPEVFRFIAIYAGASSAAPYDGRAYKSVDLGPERLGGHLVVHFHLTPRGDAATRPLTDVYVDDTTGLPRRVRADIAPQATPDLHVRFVFDFDGSARLWMVVATHVEARVHIGPGVTRSGHVDVRVEDVFFHRPPSNAR